MQWNWLILPIKVFAKWAKSWKKDVKVFDESNTKSRKIELIIEKVAD